MSSTLSGPCLLIPMVQVAKSLLVKLLWRVHSFLRPLKFDACRCLYLLLKLFNWFASFAARTRTHHCYNSSKESDQSQVNSPNASVSTESNSWFKGGITNTNMGTLAIEEVDGCTRVVTMNPCREPGDSGPNSPHHNQLLSVDEPTLRNYPYRANPYSLSTKDIPAATRTFPGVTNWYPVHPNLIAQPMRTRSASEQRGLSATNAVRINKGKTWNLARSGERLYEEEKKQGRSN
jgi:hypothetical protein